MGGDEKFDQFIEDPEEACLDIETLAAIKEALTRTNRFDGPVLVISTPERRDSFFAQLIRQGFKKESLVFANIDDIPEGVIGEQFAGVAIQERSKKLLLASLYGEMEPLGIEALCPHPTEHTPLLGKTKSKRKRSRTFHRQFIGGND